MSKEDENNDDPVTGITRLFEANEDDEDDDDGFIVSVEEIVEEVAEKMKQPFAWLIGRKGE